uniref:Transportin-1 n=3 Tax=Lygus hesperus TaxID=30085 RepID=A0A146M7U2_LYGHE
MNWQPQEEGLRQVITLLKLSQSPDNSSQKIVQQQLKELNESLDICNYYAYVLTKVVNEDEASRSLSGLVLKNHLKQNFYRINNEVLEYVKDSCVAGLRDPSQLIRASVGIVISTIVVKGGLTAWPQLLPQLCHMMDSPDYSSCEGALNTFEKICEDAKELHSMNGTDSPLNTIIPKFISFFRHSSSKLRCHAISCMNFFVVSQNPVFLRHVDLFMEGLFNLATDKDKEVCKHVCRALSLLLETKVDRLMPHMNGIVEYMLSRSQDSDESLALEGSEFWHYLTDSQICKDVLKPHLPRLVPLLINNMKLSDIEIVVLKGDREDAMIPDSDQDIRPRFYRQSDRGGNCGDGENSDDDDYDDESLLDSWNLRKSSAAALDAIATVFKNDLLPIILPVLNETLFHSDWVVKESGILALGAIAEGCFYGMIPHLNELIPFLINCMTSERSLIRVITCWTVSRYFKWVLSDPSDLYLKPLLSRLLERMLDSNKKVQQSACSALAKLEEEAGAKLVPYLDNIIQTLVTAFPNYQRKNLAILYDAVGTLARYVGQHLNKQHYIDLLMPRVIDKWNATQDDDKDIFPLFECVACIATALQVGFLPYSGPVFKRCLTLIEKTLDQQIVVTDESEYYEEPEKDLAICALDLIGSVVGAINDQVETLIINSNLMTLLYKCMQDTTSEVRQSSFTLVGDIARASFPTIRNLVGQLIPLLCQNFNPTYVSVCNNAIWSLGEICTKLSTDEIRPYSPIIIQHLMDVIHTENRLLVGIAAVTLCRLGCVCPEEMAPHLNQFAKQWCISICTTRDRIEKESSFRGMCQIIMVNPYGISQELFYFCNAAASLSYPDEPIPADLRELIGKILQGFKSQTGQEEWQTFFSRFPPQTLEHLVANYQI